MRSGLDRIARTYLKKLAICCFYHIGLFDFNHLEILIPKDIYQVLVIVIHLYLSDILILLEVDSMKKVGVLSLNVGKPKERDFGKKSVSTGFYKERISQAIFLSSVNFTGDGQGDLIHHGGVHKAVCVYPHEHYSHWERVLERTLPYGAFGENLTLTGMTEVDVCIGDSFQLGEAIVQVSQPRQPCFKLSLVYERKDLPLLVQDTGYTGFYFRVLREGMVSTTDKLVPLTRQAHAISVAEANRLMHQDKHDLEAVHRLLEVEELSPSWRKTFEKRVAGQDVDTSERISVET